MAAIYITDNQGNSTRYGLENLPLLIGQIEGVPTCVLSEGSTEGYLCQLSWDEELQTYVLSTLLDQFPIQVESEQHTNVALVPGLIYCLADMMIAYDPEAVQEEQPAEATETEAAPVKMKATAVQQDIKLKRKGPRLPVEETPIVIPKQENIIVALIKPLYVLLVLAAAFLAGLTLHHWIITGEFFPKTMM